MTGWMRETPNSLKLLAEEIALLREIEDGDDDCAHMWLLRPESDTYECELCGAEC